MSKKKLKGRTICPYCHKAFDNRTEGFLIEFTGSVVCAYCYQKFTEYITSKDSKK